jgi:MFS transporter, BCD family, chlorophyll transporter
MAASGIGWIGIVRLGLVQTALGAIVVLTTSTINRVMAVELALPAMVPGLLVAIHHAIQMLRPRLGYGSDVGGRRTPWIIGGMVVLGLGGAGAAASVLVMEDSLIPGLILATASFALIGLGTGAAGTSLLVLLAKRVEPQRRAAAATIVWVMMIAGFIVTATVAGKLLDPYSPLRLLAISSVVSVAAVVLTVFAVWGVESRPSVGNPATSGARKPPFREALREVWAEPQARRFTVFVFVSMIAFSMQDLILEPFAGTVFGLTPGQSTQLAGLQNAGVLSGMILAALACSRMARGLLGSLDDWILIGCLASAVALGCLSLAAFLPGQWPLRANVFGLGLANGAYAVAAIGSMMALVGSGRAGREGVRMGLWGAAQAIAMGLGGFAGTLASDAARLALGSPVLAYASVFAIEAGLFVAAALLALRIGLQRRRQESGSGAVRGAATGEAGGLAAVGMSAMRDIGMR